MDIGFTELLLIVVVIMILFGAGKLPTVMQDVGKGIRQFREGLKGDPKLTQQLSQEPVSQSLENEPANKQSP